MGNRRSFIRKYPVGKKAAALLKRIRNTLPSSEARVNNFRDKTFMEIVKALRNKEEQWGKLKESWKYKKKKTNE